METLNLLVFSDLHRRLTDDEQAIVDKHSAAVDLIISLGDSPVETLKHYDFGVLGNHDPVYIMDSEKNLHLKQITIKGYTLAGFQGAYRYKDGNDILYTQEEAKQFDIPKADILISHDSAYIYPDDDVHCGFQALSEYIEVYKPLVHLHGHHHESQFYKIGDTLCISVYKCARVNITGSCVKVVALF